MMNPKEFIINDCYQKWVDKNVLELEELYDVFENACVEFDRNWFKCIDFDSFCEHVFVNSDLNNIRS